MKAVVQKLIVYMGSYENNSWEALVKICYHTFKDDTLPRYYKRFWGVSQLIVEEEIIFISAFVVMYMVWSISPKFVPNRSLMAKLQHVLLIRRGEISELAVQLTISYKA